VRLSMITALGFSFRSAASRWRARSSCTIFSKTPCPKPS
jgi:hypothetical protein